MVANGGKWWQVVANGGKWWHGGGKWWQVLGGSAECAGLLDFVRSCQNLTDFDFPVSSRPAPLRGRRIQGAPRIPPDGPRELVHWFLGFLVSWLYCVLADFVGQGTTRKLAKWRFGGLVEILRAPRKRLGWQIGFKIGLEGAS